VHIPAVSLLDSACSLSKEIATSRVLLVYLSDFHVIVMPIFSCTSDGSVAFHKQSVCVDDAARQ